MNSASMKSNAWRDIISDGGSHWDEVCDTRYVFVQKNSIQSGTVFKMFMRIIRTGLTTLKITQMQS